MTRSTARILVYGTAILGFGLFSYLGYRYVILVHHALAMESLRRVGIREETAFRVYRQGTPDEAEQAQLALVELLKRELAESRFEPNRHVYTHDLALAYGRLALIAERREDPQAAARYQSQAESWLRTAYPNDRQQGKNVREVVAKLDAAGDRGLAAEATPTVPAVPSSPRPRASPPP